MTEGWTLEALKTHLECQIAALDKRHTELAAERNRAVDAALAAADQKDKSHNDVLGAMKDQQVLFVTKDQAAAQFKALTIALATIVSMLAIVAAFITFAGGVL